MSGEPCMWCHEPVLPTEPRAPTNTPMHYECGVRSAAGGLRHQMGECSCCGGNLEPDDPNLNKRAAAKVACDYFLLTHRK